MGSLGCTFFQLRVKWSSSFIMNAKLDTHTESQSIKWFIFFETSSALHIRSDYIFLFFFTMGYYLSELNMQIFISVRLYNLLYLDMFFFFFFSKFPPFFWPLLLAICGGHTCDFVRFFSLSIVMVVYLSIEKEKKCWLPVRFFYLVAFKERRSKRWWIFE
jgi:hypothetical protein